MGHGGGGQLSAELVEHLFLPAFGTSPGAELLDAASIESEELAAGATLAFSTDGYVVRPLFFPGGNIGDLAVNGTVNDLAMRGAVPLALSAGFIVEEGLELAVLGEIAATMGRAAKAADVAVVTGDTKVVDAGKADGLYITTAGVGVIRPGIDIRPSRAEPGDAIIVSGPIGLHGVAVMSRREGLEFGTGIATDSAPLNGLVAAMVGCAETGIHVLRDPTRGGLATSLCEIAADANVGIDYREADLPVPDEVAAACAFLGLDPTHIANEGRLVAVVAQQAVDDVMAAMHEHENGSGAVVIGSVVDDHPGVVVARTRLGAGRVVDMPLGEQLPRIC
jgi:hydrogenase expression/formation protein HypE